MANNKKPKPGTQPELVRTILLTTFGPDTLHWDYPSLPVGEQVIWTWLWFGQIGADGNLVRVDSLPIMQLMANPDIQDYTGGLRNGWKLPAGTWAVQISARTGDPNRIETYKMHYSNIIENFVAS